MLLDPQRNTAYRGALTHALRTAPSELVLDIGAGCGVLSLMAAAAGAPQVIGCEGQADICAAGVRIVAQHPLADRVRLLDKDCRQLIAERDLPRRADLAVFDLFDCSLIGGGVLHYIAHAREQLLTPAARLLPVRGKIRAMLVEQRLSQFWDIDVNLLNPYRFSPQFSQVDASRLDYRPMSLPFDVFEFDFRTASPEPQNRRIDVPTHAAGIAGGLLFWFDLQLDEQRWLSNAPDGDGGLHWKQGLQLLPELRVVPGTPLPLVAQHDGSQLSFHWQKEAVPAGAPLPLPRVDPRWLAATRELEQQTQRLLQHCTQNPDEYRKVATLAQHLAINPAAHQVDPVIAQRFAALFFGG